MVKLTSEFINRLGRYTKDNDEISFYHTGSGIEFLTTSSDVYLEVESFFEESAQEIWLTVEVDGSLIQRINLLPGVSTICAFRKVSTDKARKVRILRESQLDTYSEYNGLTFKNLYSKDEGDIKLLPLPSHKLSIDFIGDSLTSGEGLNGTIGELSFVSAFYGFKNDYACLTSDTLDADFSVISQSGWGLYCGYNNSLDTVTSKLYLDSSIGGKPYIDDHKTKDYIIVNVGNNDAVAFQFDEWKDEKTGKTNKMRLNEDGSMNQEDVAKIISAGIDLTNKIKELNPSAKIIWLNGMLSHDLVSVFSEIASKTNTHFIKLDVQTDFGSREHPGLLSHKSAANALISKIQELENK